MVKLVVWGANAKNWRDPNAKTIGSLVNCRPAVNATRMARNWPPSAWQSGGQITLPLKLQYWFMLIHTHLFSHQLTFP
jgi:hypothetical protein